MYGRAEGTPMAFAFVLRGNSGNSARLRALFCFGGGGAKSEAILTHSICLIQKEFFI